MEESRKLCEICNGHALLFCHSDSAFLCRSCDLTVHSANFLVARHFRSFLCRSCWNLDDRLFSGAEISPSANNTCHTCDGGSLMSSSSSSSCVSSTTEVAKRERKVVEVDEKVEGILVNWCKRMGVDTSRVVPTAVEVLKNGCSFCKITVLPFRVTLAASFWVGLRLLGKDTWRDAKNVERITGVPVKLILGTEGRLARVVKRRPAREEHVEGWAEC